jgi:hypothetical protein
MHFVFISVSPLLLLQNVPPHRTLRPPQAERPVEAIVGSVLILFVPMMDKSCCISV